VRCGRGWPSEAQTAHREGRPGADVSVSVLGIAGSPRRHGNTETLLDWALAAAGEAGAEVTKFRLRDLAYNGCIACDSCFDTGACVVKDDMQKLYPHLRAADGILLAVPIFSMGLAAQAKAMIDRCQPFWAVKYVQRAPGPLREGPPRFGGFLCCSGTNLDRVFEGALQVVKYFWHVLDVRSQGDVLIPGVDRKGEVEKITGARQRAEDLGRAVAAAG
jgi:NAD(P)H-dependent FMN reductase